MRAAVADLSWLLGKGYTPKASLKLVGDRHCLDERQRLAIARAACSDQQQKRRAASLLPLDRIRGNELVIDGFNLIITIEAALGGGVLLRCRDACVRDLASVHGTYRSVLETDQAIELIGAALAATGATGIRWLLDRPVSNSGRLARRLRDLAAARGWPWEVETVANPDAVIAHSEAVVITSDSNILDAAGRWLNFGAHLIEDHLSDVWLVDLSEAALVHAPA